MILIIDDNKDLNNLMCELLGAMGYEIRAAMCGADGIAKAKEKIPAAIICDIGMPGMNGLDVAKYIRRDHELKDVPLIAMSGYSNQADVQRAREAGFEKHLSKPFDLAVIKTTLDEVFERDLTGTRILIRTQGDGSAVPQVFNDTTSTT